MLKIRIGEKPVAPGISRASGMPGAKGLFHQFKIFTILFLSIVLGAGCGIAPSRGIQKSALPNGLTLITKTESRNPLVAITCFFKYGPRQENRFTAGITGLTLHVAQKSTSTLTRDRLSDRLDALGAALSVDVGADHAALSLSAPGSSWKEAHQLFLQILQTANFATAEVEAEKQKLLAAIRAQADEPFTYGYEKLMRIVYPTHSYGLSSLGTEPSVKTLTREQLQRWFDRMRKPEQVIICAAGGVSHRDLKNIYASAFPPLVEKFSSLPPPMYGKTQSIHISKKTSAAWILQAYPVPHQEMADYAATKVFSTLLGGGMGSKLFDFLREEKGLVYTTGASYPTRTLGSHVLFYASTPKEHARRVSSALRWAIRAWSNKTPGSDEISGAVEQLVGDHLRGHETTAARAWYLGWYELLGWGWEFDKGYIEALRSATPADVKKVGALLLSEPYEVVVSP